MPFLGTIVNFLAIFLCGLLGSLMKKGSLKKIGDGVMLGMGICIVYIGLDGALEKAPEFGARFLSDGLVKVLVMIISVALGTFLGELIDIDKLVGRLGDLLEKKLTKGEQGSFSRGFVAGSILFCVGAMAVNGSIADASGKPDILFAKSLIDGISAFVMAAGMGIGVGFSAFPVLIYQGLLTLLGMFVTSLLAPTTVYCMSVTGSLVITLIGTNMLGCTNVKTANMIPAIFLPIMIEPLLLLVM